MKQIVRLIVEESIEQCTVTGTMQGRAKVNLKVEGEVVAKMTCDFEQEPKWTIKKISSNFLNEVGIRFLERRRTQHHWDLKVYLEQLRVFRMLALLMTGKITKNTKKN